MQKNARLMILTAGYGNGHIQAARALEQRFFEQGVTDIQIIDLMKEAYPYLNTITTSIYTKSIQASTFGLDYYGWSYYMTRHAKQKGPWGKWFNQLGKKKLLQLIRQGRPDAIINTFPFGAAPEIGRHLTIPTFTVITDYALHSRWIHADMDKYYVATEELKAEMTAKGLSPGQIEVTGIPIVKAFQQKTPLWNAFPKNMDPTKKIILISAGSFGILKEIEKLIHSLSAYGDYQIAVVCGRNERLEHKLGPLYSKHPNVHIFGFIANMHELMAISSCIVTKAGGLTLTEALALQLPIFIFKPIAGQEKENAHFLSVKGAATLSHTANELEDQLLHFLSDDTYAVNMKARMGFLRKEASADHIVQDVIRFMSKEALQTV